LSLVQASTQSNDKTIVSIFVNPTQFAPNEDFNSYPRDLNQDLKLLEKTSCTAVFVPEEKEMYPDGFATLVRVNGLSEVLIGQKRPTHFEGVTTVCSKLFHLTQPDRAYFGQKDFQQVVIIRRMVNDLDFPLEIVMMPIVRESSGLAMSSRNTLLTEDLKNEARALSKAVFAAQDDFKNGMTDADQIRNKVSSIINADAPHFELAYAVVADPETLESKEKVQTGDVLLVEAYAGKIRLYDNCIF
jgi:pantoate--beta-alanine ligase